MKKLCTLLFLLHAVITTFGQRVLPVIGDNGNWPLQALGVLNDVAIHDDLLYIVGDMDNTNVVPFSNCVIWDGTNYTDFPVLPANLGIYAVTFWEDQMTIAFRESGADSVATFNGVSWIPLGGDLGGYTKDLIVHNNELYASGNVGGLKVGRWDGNNWVSTNVPSTLSGPSRLTSWNGELYCIFGQNIVAKYNGVEWTTLTSEADIVAVNSYMVHEGELYFLGMYTVDGSTYGLAKLSGDNIAVPMEGNVNHWVKAGGYQDGHFYNFSNFNQAFYQDDILLSDAAVVNSFIEPDWLTFQGKLCPIMNISLNSPFLDDNRAHLYKIEGGDMISELHPENHKVKALFSPGQDMFNVDLPGDISKGAFFFPADSVTTAFYANVLTASAIVGEDSLATFPQFAEIDSKSWFSGPLSDVVNQQYIDRYLRTWEVTAEDIEYHMAHYSDPGYTPINSIDTWPGNGNFDSGEAHILAPFIDVDNDTWYEPWEGDYPDIMGDAAVFLILNDKFHVRQSNYYFGQDPTRQLVTEAHVMFYSFANALPPIDKTVFMHVVYYNRTNEDYTDFRMGLFSDPDIGNPMNDFGGTNEELDYMYLYNTTNEDADFDDPNNDFSEGYGENPPAAACIFLSHEMNSAFVAGDQFLAPVNQRRIFKNMMGLDVNGQPWAIDDVTVGPFVFSESPCTPGVENEWNFVTEEADRTVIGTSTPVLLSAGQYTCFDAAFTVAPGGLDNFETACELEDVVSLIKSYYDQNITSSCSVVTSVDEMDTDNDQEIRCYPTPASSELWIQSSHSKSLPSTLFLYNLQGEMVKQVNIPVASKEYRLDMSALPDGMYVLRTGDFAARCILLH